MAGLASLFEGFVDPQLLQQKQQQQFGQNLAQSTDPRQFIATVGSNLGMQLGQGAQGLFGGQSKQDKIKQILQSVSNIEDPLKQAEAARQAFQAAGMPKEAEIMTDRIIELEKEKSSLAYQKAQTEYYNRRDGSGGTAGSKGQTISMLNYIGEVRRKVLQGEEVSEAELMQAEDYRNQLMKQKSYVDDNGRIVTISQAQVAPIPRPKGAPAPAGTEGSTGTDTTGAPAPAPAPATGTTTTTDGARVTETPASLERKQMLSDQRQSAIKNFQIGKNRIDEIMSERNFTRGITGALASIVPGTKAYSQRLALKTVIAKTVIQTLNDLKNQSKTGATGFGALNKEELENIQAAITNLSPTDDRFDARLQELKDMWDAAIVKLEKAEAEAGNKPQEQKKERKPLSAFAK